MNDVRAGNLYAAEELLPLVYAKLRQLAQHHMSQERSDHTLQATALVHEAFLKLVGRQDIEWMNRAHFYAAAAVAMRRILVDHARKRGRSKRGGDRQRVPLKSVNLAVQQDSSEILAFDGALERLQKEDERMFQVVMLRFFAGLCVDDVAKALEISPRTVKREWSCARAWLYRALSEVEA